MELFSKKPKCPYCDFKLDKKPTRKQKCPNCFEYIRVKGGELYTEKQIDELAFKGTWLRKLKFYGANEEMFKSERSNLSQKFGFEASVNDTFWGMMMKLLSMQKGDLYNMEQLYQCMGDFVVEEGKDPEPYIQESKKVKEKAMREQLYYWKRVYRTYSNVRAEIYTANDEYVCDVCKNASKRTYTVDEFLETMPIPIKCTSSHGCRCHIVESVK